MANIFYAFYAIFLYHELNGTNQVSWWWFIGAVVFQIIMTIITMAIDWNKARDAMAIGMYQNAKKRELSKV